MIFRKLMTSWDPETNKGLELYIKVAMKLRKTFQIWTCYNLWGTLMCWVSLERSAVIWSVAEQKTFVEFQDFLVLARALAGLSCGVGGSWLGVPVLGSALGNLHSRFHRGIWTVNFLVAAPGLVFLLCFGPVWMVSISGSGLVWVGLGWSGLVWASIVMRGLWGLAGFFCFPVGRMSVPLFGTLDIFTLYKILSKYRILKKEFVFCMLKALYMLTLPLPRRGGRVEPTPKRFFFGNFRKK